MKTLIVLALLIGARPLSAQLSCAHRRRCFAGDEYATGAAMNLISRGPWFTASTRRPLARLAWTTGASVFYEMVLDNHGWESRDFLPRLSGYLITEGLIALVRRKF